jgi:WD40 repeat protein
MRFSLGTLLVSTVFLGALLFLWTHWDAWYLEHQLIGHKDEVLSIRFSPDGKYVLTASRDNTARLWDSRSGNALVIMKHSDWVNSAEFSADGSSIVTKSWNIGSSPIGGELKIWAVPDGSIIKQYETRSTIAYAEFFNDASHVAVFFNDEFYATVFDLKTDEHEKNYSLRDPSTNKSDSISTDGEQRATASYDHGARLWRFQRPDTTFGILLTPQFWIAVFTAICTFWCIIRDWRCFAKLRISVPSKNDGSGEQK